MATRSFYEEVQSARGSVVYAKVAKVGANLQHMKQSRLSSIVETEEKELGMLVHKTKRGEDIVDYSV